MEGPRGPAESQVSSALDSARTAALPAAAILSLQLRCRQRDPARGPRTAGPCRQTLSRSVPRGGASSTIQYGIRASPLLPTPPSWWPEVCLSWQRGPAVLPSLLFLLPKHMHFEKRISLSHTTTHPHQQTPGS